MQVRSLLASRSTWPLRPRSALFRFPLFVVGYVLCCLAPETARAHAETAPRSSPDLPAFACCDDGSVYSLRVMERNDRLQGRGQELLIAKLSAEGEITSVRKPVSVAFVAGLPRWRVSNGYLWIAGGPPNGYSFFERIPFQRLRTYKEVQDRVEASILNDWGLEPVSMLLWRYFHLDPESSNTSWEDIHYDLLPQGKDSVVVLMAWQKQILVWRGEKMQEKLEGLGLSMCQREMGQSPR